MSDALDEAVRCLIDTLRGMKSEQQNSAIMLSYRIAHLRKQRDAGLLSEGDATVEYNRIRAAVLEVGDEVLREHQADDPRVVALRATLARLHHSPRKRYIPQFRMNID